MDAATLPRHPLNEGFEWIDHDGPRTVLTADEVARYDRDGAFVLHDALSPADLAAAESVIDPLEAEMEAFLRDRGGRLSIARADEITFTLHLAARSAVLRELVAGPVLRGVGHDLIGPDVRLYWDQAVYKKPDTDAVFPWHQDNGYAFVEPQAYLTCWIPLNDATLDNGCPWIVPGLHRGGTYEHRSTELGFVCLDEAPDAVPVPARAGDVVVFSSLTPHCTGPNTTDGVRKAYIVQYAPDGAEVLQPQPGGSVARVPANDPDRQFPILVGGRPA